MNKRDMILELVRQKGPIIPSDIMQDVQENTTLIGAYLSELVSSKIVQITHAKIGGSPAYFMPSQREKLSRLREHLNEKDQQAYDKLEKRKILRDMIQTPLERYFLYYTFYVNVKTKLYGRLEI